MMNGSRSELEARPQHRASEHIHVDEKPGFIPEVAVVTRDVTILQNGKDQGSPWLAKIRYVQLY
jgi:hypothetical protein